MTDCMLVSTSAKQQCRLLMMHLLAAHRHMLPGSGCCSYTLAGVLPVCMVLASMATLLPMLVTYNPLSRLIRRHCHMASSSYRPCTHLMRKHRLWQRCQPPPLGQACCWGCILGAQLVVGAQWGGNRSYIYEIERQQ